MLLCSRSVGHPNQVLTYNSLPLFTEIDAGTSLERTLNAAGVTDEVRVTSGTIFAVELIDYSHICSWKGYGCSFTYLSIPKPRNGGR